MFNRYHFNCKDCQNRYVGCQSECEDYINAKREGDREKALLRAEKKKESDYDSFIIGASGRFRRSRH